ncbi:MAG TPA: DUF296 domain-containing protein [Micromonosporaceae bacterium]
MRQGRGSRRGDHRRGRRPGDHGRAGHRRRRVPVRATRLLRPAAHAVPAHPGTRAGRGVSLLGDVAEKDGKPALHLHAVVGRSDGTTMGGHLLRGEVWPTLEVLVTEVGPELAKRYDPETGLALLAP